MNAVTQTSLAQVVRRIRPLFGVAEAPDFFAMLDEQARTVVNLARIVGEVLQGKESTHSLRLLDLEQRREELQRRNEAAVHSLRVVQVGVDEMHSTIDALDKVAAGLFQTARAFQQLRLSPDEVALQMLLVIEKAIGSLQHGYARLATGSPTAELDADAAIASRNVLAGYRDLRLLPLDLRLAPSTGQSARPPDTSLPGGACWRYALYGNLSGVAHELAGAAAILKSWSQKLAAGPRAGTMAAAMCCLSQQPRVLS